MKTVWFSVALSVGLSVAPSAWAQEHVSPPAEAPAAPEETVPGLPEGLETPEVPPAAPLPAADAPVVTEAAPVLEPVTLPPPTETIVVGTSEVQTSGAAHIIKAGVLQRFELDDPHAILRSVPGVYARGEDGFGLRPNIGLRGANADRSKKVTLLEDGILLGPAPYSAPAAYYFPLMTRMQAVRVLKGPAAIVQGPQTVGGSVEFLTREIPFEEGFGADLAGGEYHYGKAHAYYGASTERSGFLVEGVHLRSDGFKDIDASARHTGFVRNEWMVKARHRLDTEGETRQTLQLKMGYSDEGSNETYLGLTDADLHQHPNRRYLSTELDRMEWKRTQLVGTYALTHGTLQWTTSLYRQDFNRTWRKANRFRGAALSDVLSNPETARNAIFYSVLTGAQDTSSAAEVLMVGPNRRVFVSQGLQSVARWTASTGPLQHHVEAGARYHFDSVDRLHTEDGFRVESSQLVAEGTPTLTTASNHDSTHALALHLMDAITWGRWALTPGVRTELIRSHTRDRLTHEAGNGRAQVLLPGVGLHAQVAQSLGAFAGVHRGFSPPAPGQGDQRPEESLNYEAGARWARRGQRLEVVGFFNDYSNLTDVCTFSSGCLDDQLDRQYSAGKAHIYGLEAFGEATLRPGGAFFIPLTVAYTLTRTRLLENFDSADPQLGRVQAGDALPYVPRHQVYASAGVDRAPASFFISATFVDAMRETAGRGSPLSGFFTEPLLTFDATARYFVSPGARVYLTAQNLFDRQVIVSRRPFGARPNAPRMIQLGLKYEL